MRFAHLAVAVMTAAITLSCNSTAEPGPPPQPGTTAVDAPEQTAATPSSTYTPSTLPPRTATTGSATSTPTAPEMTTAPTAPTVTLGTVPINIGGFDASAHPACALLSREALEQTFGPVSAPQDPGTNPAAYYSDACAWNLGAGRTLTVELYTATASVDPAAYYNTVKTSSDHATIAGAEGFIDNNFPVAYVLTGKGTMVGLVMSENSDTARKALASLAGQLRT